MILFFSGTIVPMLTKVYLQGYNANQGNAECKEVY